jgi:hypothetical protein
MKKESKEKQGCPVEEQNKKRVTKKEILYWGLFVAIFTIATMGLVFSLSDIECKFLSFSPDKFGTIIGAFVSATALVITVYFVILAISAYNHVREIQKQKEDIDNNKIIIDKHVRDIQKSKEIIDKQVRDIQNNKDIIDKQVCDIEVDKQEIDRQKEWIEEFLRNYAQTLYDVLTEQIIELEK